MRSNMKTAIGIHIKSGLAVKLSGNKEMNAAGFCHVNISRCCNGKQKTHAGYKWYYVDNKHHENE